MGEMRRKPDLRLKIRQIKEAKRDKGRRVDLMNAGRTQPLVLETPGHENDCSPETYKTNATFMHICRWALESEQLGW